MHFSLVTLNILLRIEHAKKDGLLLKVFLWSFPWQPDITHTHTGHSNTIAGQWGRPIHFIQRIMSRIVTSPMMILEINVGFLGKGTNIQIPGKCKQCMQIWNMSLKRSLKYSAREISHSITKCGLSYQKRKKEKNGKTNKNPFPSFSLKGKKKQKQKQKKTKKNPQKTKKQKPNQKQ